MINTFKQHYLEAVSTEEIVVSFGRFNPPTNGHEKLLAKVSKISGGMPYRIYASQTNDAKKNPLSYKAKIKFMRKMFPKHARSIIADKKIKTLFNVLSKVQDDGFKKCSVVVGSDRVQEFDKILNKYNGVKGKHGFYDFEGGVKIVSAGERDPDSDDVSGMSASKLRLAAKENDLITFTKGMPKGFKDAKGLMNAVRDGMGLKESDEYKQNCKLKRKSYIREKYVNGKLFNIGDKVIITKTREDAIVQGLNANHISVLVNDEMKNVWISDIVRSK
ncbi:MAG: hypothetical protein CMD98_06835 [Gammaproteobacteria bacterium]|nr:hypothetical protein [Gammaproteobacteria bacterium]|tara:strand:+ start:38458 stop:39282 length:825 start_codon:yes stop_codon:yes gene_type:complete